MSRSLETNKTTRSGKRIFVTKDGFFHLEDSNQLKSLSQSHKELGAYKHIDFKGKRVLDLGACAGSFCRLSLNGGCEAYVGVEPDEENFDCLTLNANNDPRATLINKAAIRGDAPCVEFLVLNSGDKLSGEVLREESVTRNRSVISVPALNFHKLLDEFQPDIIKMDVEGAEFELLDRKLPDCVNQIVMEIHVFNKPERLKALWFTIFKEVFGSDSWRCDLQPVFNTDNEFSTFRGFNIMQMGFKREKDWKAIRASRIAKKRAYKNESQSED